MSKHTLEDEMTGVEAQHDPEFANEAEVFETDDCIFDEGPNLRDCYEP